MYFTMLTDCGIVVSMTFTMTEFQEEGNNRCGKICCCLCLLTNTMINPLHWQLKFYVWNEGVMEKWSFKLSKKLFCSLSRNSSCVHSMHTLSLTAIPCKLHFHFWLFFFPLMTNPPFILTIKNTIVNQQHLHILTLYEHYTYIICSFYVWFTTHYCLLTGNKSFLWHKSFWVK